MKNPIDSVVNVIKDEINNPRSRDVLLRRYGLKYGRPETLESIGQSYNITRERVRQIENDVFKAVSRPRNLKILTPYFKELEDYLNEYGRLRREERIFDDYTCVCLPARSPEKIGDKKEEAAFKREVGRCRGAVYLLLNLGEAFSRVSESNDFHPVWTLDASLVKKASEVVNKIVKKLDSRSETSSLQEVAEWLKAEENQAPDEKAVHSYIDASKHVYENPFGDIGMWDWPEISPRGVKDKAYLVLKKEQKPLHFTEVTNMINQLLPGSRQAYLQTVHNELIKDPRFVLIGRGVYALTDWGYEPGTVCQVIAQILQKEGPLKKGEILEKVKSSRLVKDNTILINLQNKGLFQKLPDGRYGLVQ